ncbi:MAG: EAL domain-containing protein [Actinomycetota bacterium]
MSDIRVLIAEDDTTFRSALCDVIRSDPSLTLIGEAQDAAEAIELACRCRPDVALLDVRMPFGGGMRAATEIQIFAPQTRIVALSVSEDRETVLEMLRGGATGYLVKGGSMDDILSTIHRCARGEAVLSAEIAGDVIWELRCGHRPNSGTAQRAPVTPVAVSVTPGPTGALRARAGRSDLSFEPVYNLERLRIVGFEARTRPRSDLPEGRAHRVPRLPDDLELAALATAVQSLKTLPRHAFLSLDPSLETLTSDRFDGALGLTSAERIVVEIPSRATDGDDEVMRAVDRARAHGARIAVDGTRAARGHVSCLLEVMPDIITLHPDLVRGIDASPVKRVLTAVLVSLAGDIGTTVSARGIETAAEVRILIDLGVEQGQGPHLRAPGSLSELLGTTTATAEQ